MERIIASVLIMISTEFFTESLPVKNAVSVKYKPISAKEAYPKSFGGLFAKISQDLTPEAILRRELLSKALPAPSPELGSGCSNQVARVMFPMRRLEYNTDNASAALSMWSRSKYLNLPVIKEPYKDYKVLVAEAPPEMRIDQKDEKIVIYVVFPDNKGTISEEKPVSIPEIYFVNKPSNAYPGFNAAAASKTEEPDVLPRPILVNQNRTVTGLKRKQVEMLLNFKNNRRNHYYFS